MTRLGNKPQGIEPYPEALDRLLRFMLWLTVAVVYCCLVELHGHIKN